MNVAIYGETEEFLNFDYMAEQFNNKEMHKITPMFYQNEKMLITHITENKIKIVILIHSKNQNNIFNLCSKIKKQNTNCKIIFCSHSKEFAIDGYKADLTYYILLPLSYKEFVFAIKKCLKFFKKNNDNTIIIKSNWQKIPVPIDDICFAEKQGHNIIIHTVNKKLSTRSTFKDFITMLKNREEFIIPIRGTIVNMHCVDSIQMQSLLIKNGSKIPIRRQDRKKIKELLFNFKLNYE